MIDYYASKEGGEYLYPLSGDAAPPKGVKVQLLTKGGVHISGFWNDDCIAWLPLPKRNKEKEKCLNLSNV